jgi:hypothetical protein
MELFLGGDGEWMPTQQLLMSAVSFQETSLGIVTFAPGLTQSQNRQKAQKFREKQCCKIIHGRGVNLGMVPGRQLIK